MVHTARTRVVTALRGRARQEDVGLTNGDLFLYWRDRVSSAQSGYKGPAVCLGTHRAIVLGLQGGQVITAHVSRFLLHRRGSHHEEIVADAPWVLPPHRDVSLEAALTEDDCTIPELISELNQGDEEHNHQESLDTHPLSSLNRFGVDVRDYSPCQSDPEDLRLPIAMDTTLPKIDLLERGTHPTSGLSEEESLIPADGSPETPADESLETSADESLETRANGLSGLSLT
jgi:hypothetical protein